MKKIFIGLLFFCSYISGASCPDETDKLKKDAQALQKDALSLQKELASKTEPIKAYSDLLKNIATDFQKNIEFFKDSATKLETLATPLQAFINAYKEFNDFLTQLKTAGTQPTQDDMNKAKNLQTQLLAVKKTFDDAWQQYKKNNPQASDQIGEEIGKLQKDVLAKQATLIAFIKTSIITLAKQTALYKKATAPSTTNIDAQFKSITLQNAITQFKEQLTNAIEFIKTEANNLQAYAQKKSDDLLARKNELEERGKKLSKECNPLASGKEIANALKGAFSALASGNIKGFVGGIFDAQQGVLNTTKGSFGMADTLSKSMTGKLGNLVGLKLNVAGINFADTTFSGLADFSGGITGSLGKLATGDFSGFTSGLETTFTNIPTIGKDMLSSITDLKNINIPTSLPSLPDIKIPDIPGF